MKQCQGCKMREAALRQASNRLHNQGGDISAITHAANMETDKQIHEALSEWCSHVGSGDNPRRKYEICVRVDGHTFQDALRELLVQADHIQEHGENCSSVGGGGPSSHIVNIDIHPTMTPEQFNTDLLAWKARRDAQYDQREKSLEGKK